MNNGVPKGCELPITPGEPPPASESMPAEMQRALDDLYGCAPEVSAKFDQQVIAAATQVMSAAGQAGSALRRSPAREHRRIQMPLAAGLAASLLLVVCAWVLLSTTGGLGGTVITSGTVVTGDAAESRSAKAGTKLIGKASPGRAAADGHGDEARGRVAMRKETPALATTDATGAVDADDTGARRQRPNMDGKLGFGEPASEGQQLSPASTAAMSDVAERTTGFSLSSQAPPVPNSVLTPVLVPAEAANQPASAGSPAPNVPALSLPVPSSPAPNSPALGAIAPERIIRGGGSNAAGGTTGAAMPPKVPSAVPTVDATFERGDESVVKPGAGEKEKAEATALDVVDAFRLAWIVKSEAAAGDRPSIHEPRIGASWMASARRDIDANGVVNQADVDALLCELVKVPLVTPAADDRSGADVLFDVVLDTGEALLAGYQVEIIGQGKAVRVVSVGAGTSVAFSEPPKYDGVSLGLALGYGDSRIAVNSDPRDRNTVHLKSGIATPELEGSKPLRLAAVSLSPAERLPHGQFTVARIGWRTADGAEPRMGIKLLAAVDVDGKRIKPTVKLERVQPVLK